MPMSEATGYKVNMMICGGSKLSTKDASNMCWALNPDDPSPTWTRMPDMPSGRLMPDAVLLPGK